MDVLKKCLEGLKEKGAEKAEVNLTKGIKEEMNIHSGEISLLRSLEEYHLEMTALIDQKKDTIKINKIDDASIQEAIVEVIENAKNSELDPANDIPVGEVQKHYEDPKTGADIEKMHQRLTELIREVHRDFENLVIEEAVLEHLDTHRYYENSNGASLSSNGDLYNFMIMFFAKKGKQTSSFNYTVQSTRDLEKALLDMGSLKNLLKESIDHLAPEEINENKFTGEVIVTPGCMNEVVPFLLAHLSNQYLISGISKFRDKINQKALDEKLTLRTEPDSQELAVKDYFGQDGFIQRNDDIFKNGVLKNYLLNYYGALKTGYKRGPSTGANLVIEPGTERFQEMIKSMDQGIILSRFSGGMPAPNGDFSGIAKNSYYVEGGEIRYPIKETMISGNIFTMFENIKEISKERINSGQSLMPYFKFDNVVIS